MSKFVKGVRWDGRHYAGERAAALTLGSCHYMTAILVSCGMQRQGLRTCMKLVNDAFKKVCSFGLLSNFVQGCLRGSVSRSRVDSETV